MTYSDLVEQYIEERDKYISQELASYRVYLTNDICEIYRDNTLIAKLIDVWQHGEVTNVIQFRSGINNIEKRSVWYGVPYASGVNYFLERVK